MIVQADFAHGTYARVGQAIDQARFHGVIVKARIMRMHAGRQAQARQRTRCCIVGQREACGVGTVGQMRQLVAAGRQHLARALHRFRQARLRLGIPVVDVLEHVRGIFLHINNVADEAHTPCCTTRELQRGICQQMHMRVRVRYRAIKPRRLHQAKLSMLAFLPKQRIGENRLLLFLGHASLPYTYICSRAKGLPFARTLSATSPKCQDSKCRDVRRGEGGSFAAIRRSIERSTCL